MTSNAASPPSTSPDDAQHPATDPLTNSFDTLQPSLDIPPPLHTGTSIQIRAPREQVFTLARDLHRWPELLPHYRSVQTLGTGEKGSIVRMAAFRSGIPISWVSEFWADERALELHFLHLRYWTKGMKVVWTLTPTRDGTRVEIIHDLAFRIPLLAWLAEPIIGGFFIGHIAGQTLAEFKKRLEQ